MPKRVLDWAYIAGEVQRYLERMKADGVTQEEVGRRFGLSQSQISNLKRGVRRSSALSTELLRFIGAVLGDELPYIELPVGDDDELEEIGQIGRLALRDSPPEAPTIRARRVQDKAHPESKPPDEVLGM